MIKVNKNYDKKSKNYNKLQISKLSKIYETHF